MTARLARHGLHIFVVLLALLALVPVTGCGVSSPGGGATGSAPGSASSGLPLAARLKPRPRPTTGFCAVFLDRADLVGFDCVRQQGTVINARGRRGQRTADHDLHFELWQEKKTGRSLQVLYAYLPDWGQAGESLDQTQTTRKFATRKRSGLGDDAFEGNDGKRYHVGFRKGDAMVVLAGADQAVVNQAASAIEKRVVLAGLGGDIR